MFVACLHHLEDHDDPAGVVARYLDAMAPGSYLVLSHCTDEFAYEKMHEGSAHFKRRGGIFAPPRGKSAIARMFNGRELLDPGLVLVSYWRPDHPGKPDPNADRVMAYGGIAALLSLLSRGTPPGDRRDPRNTRACQGNQPISVTPPGRASP